jgi:CheY-like chemotaxis protein
MNRDSTTPTRAVLVVDDHAISRRFIAAALRQSDWRVKQAATAGDALAIARRWLPRVVLIDVNLRGANGFDLARRIWEDWPGSLQRPRIVMISADAPDSRQLSLSGRYVDRFLLKPVSDARLRDALEPGRSGPALTDGLAETEPELQQLFRRELSTQLEKLDRCLAARDLSAANGILHQLIASSGLCREPGLERKLRNLDERCRKGAGAAELGHEYFSLLVSARDFLAPA